MKKRRFAIEKIVAVANRRNQDASGRPDAANQHFRAYILWLEEAVCRHAVGPGVRTQADAGRNVRLKKLMAELSLNKAALQNVETKM